MVIQDLKPSRRVPGRWLAALEDGSILRLGEAQVADFALYAGMELSDEQAQALLDAARRDGLKEKALELLSRKPLSRRELEQKLEQWGAEAESRDALCHRLEELGYLDDAAYARRVVSHFSARGFGVKKLRDELCRRGVPRELWDEALEGAEDPAEAIDAFLAKKLGGKAADRRELQKVSAALARRGYQWPDISDALRRYGAEVEED